jgi:HEAT repeat protein
MGEMSKEIPNDLKDRIKILYIDNPKKIAKALDYIGKNGERASVAVPFIMSMMQNLMGSNDPDEETLANLIDALGAIGDTRATPDLIAALEHKSSKVRGQAILSLGKMKDQRAITPLISLLIKDQHVERVMDALGEMGEPVVKQLLDEFKGGDPNVRINVAFTLGDIGTLRAVGPLIKALEDSNIEVAKASAFALGEIRDLRAVEPLIAALKHKNIEVRNSSASALGRIKDPRAVDPLIKAVSHSDRSVRIHAIRALGAIRNPRAVLPLINALEEKNWNVQRYTTWALKNITGKKLGKKKDVWLKWYEEEGKKK